MLLGYILHAAQREKADPKIIERVLATLKDLDRPIRTLAQYKELLERSKAIMAELLKSARLIPQICWTKKV
jgi:hypothetical protein